MAAFRWLATHALIVGLYACGGEEQQAPAAGAPSLPGLAMPCTADCMGGLACSSQGHFAGQCTASCNNNQACQLVVAGSECFGMAGPQCGLPCTGSGTCPAGTACQPVDGRLACRRQ